MRHEKHGSFRRKWLHFSLITDYCIGSLIYLHVFMDSKNALKINIRNNIYQRIDNPYNEASKYISNELNHDILAKKNKVEFISYLLDDLTFLQ